MAARELRPTSSTFNTLMAMGQWHQALRLFEEMLRRDIQAYTG